VENKDLITPQKLRSTSQVISSRKAPPQSAKLIRPKSPVIINKTPRTEKDKNKTQNIKTNTVKFSHKLDHY
jgi:hypothetical protein